MNEKSGVSKALTYASYLRLDELLKLQTPKSSGPEHDELLFIIIHQVYELWFKELLHEIDYLSVLLRNNESALANHTTHRILAILKTIVAQLDVLETMTPLEFNSFRRFLESASGFQSAQFRELEFVLGYKRKSTLRFYPEESDSWKQLQMRLGQPTLWDAFLAYLAQKGYPVALDRDITRPVEPSSEVQAVLLTVYRQDSTAMNICENMIDMDEGFQEWRYHHVKMVERTIGNQPGTGGSAGAEYLATTLKPFFPDLWLIRSRF